MKPIIGLSSSYVPPGDPRCPSQSGAYYMNRSYVRLLTGAGGLPIALPHVAGADDLGQLLDHVDALLLTGGRDLDPSSYGEEPHPAADLLQPERSASDLALTRLAIERRIPIFGTCLGLQTLNVALGGSLWQDLPTQHPTGIAHRMPVERHADLVHSVDIVEGSLLHRLVGATRLDVNSTHHQAVKEMGKGLVVTARAPDGVVEGLELPGLPFCHAVQWHPESLPDNPPHRRLFEAFVEEARRAMRRTG